MEEAMRSGSERQRRRPTTLRRALIGGSAVIAAAAIVPATASAAITSVFSGQTISGQPIPCTALSDGVRVCHGTDGGGTGPDLRLKSFDGQPLEVYVILPPAPSSGSDGPYPLIVQSHGFGSQADGPTVDEYMGPSADAFAKQGYAVLQLSARGSGDSCGKKTLQAAPSVYLTTCQTGWVHLDDDRYEARDVQYTIGLLVDEGIADAAKIGVTGESYGGGVSLQLATLKNRVMLPDGTLVPWTSPHGTPLSIAAAAPMVPWSDLAYSLVPNGHLLDDQIASPTTDESPVGVMKQSIVTGLYAVAQKSGTYSPPGVDPQSDLTSWLADISAGEPYDTNSTIQSIVTQFEHYHSAYYLLDGAFGTAKEPPPPLLIANGFTDDIFGVDEALRYYNLEHSLYPSDPISLFDGDFGHPRAQGKKDVSTALSNAVDAFFDYYLKGAGSPPPPFTAYTETCPSTAPSGGPFIAQSWGALHSGEVDYSSATAQTVSSTAGNPTVSATFDPFGSIAVAGVQGTSQACVTASATPEGAGVATYRLPAATGSGYTLLGSPTVTANLTATGSYPYLAARLLDVNPANNTETLVARGVYRLSSSAADGVQTFQLHPGAWHFAAGHMPELELLGRDAPYLRPSNGTFSISVSDLQLRLPVHDAPGNNPTVTTPTLALTPGCPTATGKLSGTRLGRIRLGMTRAQAHKAYPKNASRGKHYEQFFCLSPIGIRVGYASPKLLSALKAAQRRRAKGRVVWASTSSPYYSLKGIRPATSVAAARHRLKLERGFHIGLNWWYFARNGSSNALIKARHGVVEEIGIVTKALTRNRKAQRRVLTSFS
jgi:dienelactone hydrolase